MPSNRQTGFTLIELMVVLSVLALLLAMAWPSFQGSLRSNRIATTTNELVASVAMARSEAIRNTRGAGMCSSDDGTSCSGNWSGGWLVWADTDGDGALGDGETVLRYTQLNSAVAATGPAAAVSFDSRGRRRAAADQALSLQPATCDGQLLRRAMTINAAGQVRVAKETCS